MGLSSYDNWNKAVTTGTIIGSVIGSIVALIFLISFIVIIICLIKQWNRRRRRNRSMHGMVLEPQQQFYPYPHPLATQFPPDTTSIAHYPMSYQPAPPPYNTLSTDFTKPPIY